MKKIIILLLLYFMAYAYSPQLQTTMRNLTQSAPVQQTLTQVTDYVDAKGWPQRCKELWQKALGTTLQTVSGISSDNPTVEKSMRLLEQHLQTQLKTLPSANPSSLKLQVSPKITLYAGDSGVTEENLKTAASLITTDSLRIIQENTNLSPKRQTDVVLYSAKQDYGNALLQAGIPSGEIPALVSQTGGITVNSSVWIPMFNLQGKADLANVLTHELTHVSFNQAGIGSALPLWLNEGICWHNGLAAQSIISPNQTKLEIKALTASLKKVEQNGELLPLHQIDQGLLNASYNVEFQGYLATEQLIKQHGLDSLKTFLAQAQTRGVKDSFAQSFGQTLSEFEASFKI